MTHEEILENLKNNVTICVANTWYFTGKAMSCTNTQDFPCCEIDYESIEEAADDVIFLANDEGTNIEIYD